MLSDNSWSRLWSTPAIDCLLDAFLSANKQAGFQIKIANMIFFIIFFVLDQKLSKCNDLSVYRVKKFKQKKLLKRRQ